MVYDVSNLLAERERLIGEIQWYNQQPETMWKRNEVNKRITRINQIDAMMQQGQMNQYQQPMQPQYGSYGYRQNMSPYVNQQQYQPMNSPYQERYTPNNTVGYNYNSSVNDITNNRYANKPLPQDSIRNDPPASYRVESKPVVTQPVKKEEKKYTSNSLYPLLCDVHIKEIERKLDTGYYERYETIVREANDLGPFILEKTKKDITTIDDFYNTFANKLDFNKLMAFTFFKNELYIIPNEISDENFEEVKKYIKTVVDEDNKDERLGMIFKALMLLTPRSTTNIEYMTSYNYTVMFNGIMKYCYNSKFECDDLLTDMDEVTRCIENIKVVKDKDNLYSAINHLAKQFNKTEVNKVYDNKFIKVQLKVPTLLVYNKEYYGILNVVKGPMTLRKESIKDLYEIVTEAFKYFGDHNKFINVIFVDHFFRQYNLRAYSHKSGDNTQYIVTNV